MYFGPFQEFFPEKAAGETRHLTISVPLPGGPPVGTYCFIEMFCTAPQCDCRNAMIGVYKFEGIGKFEPITTLRFCWEDTAFYKKIELDFHQKRYPCVFADLHSGSCQYDAFFSNVFEEMCYDISDDRSSIQESAYAKRIKLHYDLYRGYLISKASEGKNKSQSVMGRNELCSCGSGTKYKKCCGKVSASK